MPVTTASWYIVPQGQSRISREKFGQLARFRFAPAVLAERAPEEYYDAIQNTTVLLEGVRYQVDALFLFEMFGHESTYGKAGVATQTHCWGNARLPSIGITPVLNPDGTPKTVPGASGVFPVYANWRDGCITTAARLLNHVYFDWGRRAIRDIFVWPANPKIVWAPDNDNNDPDNYLNTVVSGMNADGDRLDGGGSPIPTPSGKSVGIVVTAGHWDSTGDEWGGVERARTRPLAEAIARLAREEGFRVRLQPDEGQGQFNGTYRDVAAWAADVAEAEDLQMLLQCHHQGTGNPAVSGAFVVYPEASERDNDYDPTARAFGLDVVRNMRDRDIMPQWSDGDLSEGETAAGRLAWFSYTAHLKDTKERVLIEYSACNSNLQDRARVDAPGWYDKAARATVDALIKLYGPQKAGDVPGPVPPKLVLPGTNPYDPDGKKNLGFVLGFRDALLAMGGGKYPADPALGALSIVGYPSENEWTDADGDAWQRCQKAVLHYQNAFKDNLPWNIVLHNRGEKIPDPKKKEVSS